MSRKEAPNGRELAEKARGKKLDKTRQGVGHKNGKKSVLTPAALDHIKNKQDLEDGAFIGVLDTELEGEAVPPGTYNMFIAKVGGEWRGYIESDGEILAEANAVERPDTPSDMKPEFSSGSFCWWVWLIFTGFQLCV